MEDTPQSLDTAEPTGTSADEDSTSEDADHKDDAPPTEAEEVDAEEADEAEDGSTPEHQEGDGDAANEDADASDDGTDADAVGESEDDAEEAEAAPFQPTAAKDNGLNYEFDELPPRLAIMGGTTPRPYLITVAVTFMLIFSFGMVDRYNENYELDFDFAHDKMIGDCVHYINHIYGNGFYETYNTSAPKYIECVDYMNEHRDWNMSYTWWQDARDAEAQAILDAISAGSTEDGNHSGYVWTEGGVSTMAVYAAFFGQNMSVYGDPAAGDEFSNVHMGIWNGFGGTNETFEDLVDGGASPYNIPGGMIAVKPSGYIWTEAGVNQMAVYATFFGQNMSIYGDPVAGDVFTSGHLGIWNGFGGGNDTFEDLVPGGGSTFNIPAGMITYAPTGFVWSHSGVATMTYYATTFFGTNMSVYDDPAPGDVFRQKDLDIWNGYGATMGAGNDTFEQLVPGGNATFNVPAGIVMTAFEWTNQTPSVSNVSILNATDNGTTTYTCDYTFNDAQGDNDTSVVVWLVDGVESGNGTTYDGSVGAVLRCEVTPSDGVYVGETVVAETDTSA